MSEITISKRDNLAIRVSDSRGYIEAQTVEAQLMFAILERIDEISKANQLRQQASEVSG